MFIDAINTTMKKYTQTAQLIGNSYTESSWDSFFNTYYGVGAVYRIERVLSKLRKNSTERFFDHPRGGKITYQKGNRTFYIFSLNAPYKEDIFEKMKDVVNQCGYELHRSSVKAYSPTSTTYVYFKNTQESKEMDFLT